MTCLSPNVWPTDQEKCCLRTHKTTEPRRRDVRGWEFVDCCKIVTKLYLYALWLTHKHTQSLQNGKQTNKIAQEFRLCGVLIWPLVKYWVTKLDPDNYIQARYGNPDVQILGTLKIKLHIFRFLNITRKNMGSIFIFRVPIYSPISKSADIWEPWKLKWFQNIKKI